MAAVARISLPFCPIYNSRHKTFQSFLLRSKALLQQNNMFSSSYYVFYTHHWSMFKSRLLFRIAGKRHIHRWNCYAVNKPSPSYEISSTAKIRSEVLSPFRTVRMFFYLAFITSSALGGLIAITQLISALANPSKAPNKIISVRDLRGIARLVILVGPVAYINESFKRSKAFTDGLLERGVLVIPFITDDCKPEFESEDSKEKVPIDQKTKRLWQLRPAYVAGWNNWIDEQRKFATVSLDSPVYLSLRMDGRVRGSGVGYPPWSALVTQLPPFEGLWSGIFDGMDGSVL